MSTHPHKHVGQFIRESVIPKGVTVTKAANLLGVSRPALSNLLNGKAALSTEMARKLAQAFGRNADELLQWQPQKESEGRSLAIPDPHVRRHVPTMAKITATDLDRWADEIETRALFPVLLRRLALSSGASVTSIDFPGHDNAQRPGADGIIEASSPSPWVPDGRSLWEFGCNKDPGKKANSDYNERLKLPRKERENTTYVAATPRDWPGKAEWVRKKREAGDWKNVVAFDANDLEQAIEQSAPTQVWLAEQINKSSDGATSLDEHWHNWSSVCDPELAPSLFAEAVSQTAAKVAAWLRKPPEAPFLISADSKEEALAFLHCLFCADDPELQLNRDRVIVVSKPGTLKKIATASADIVQVIENGETERALGDLPRRLHTIIVRPQRSVGRDKLDIELNVLRFSQLAKALEEMGFSRDEANAFWRQSGGSPTVLRRVLASVPEVREPEWARDSQAARSLCPLWLVGNWNTGFEADREILKLVAGVEDYAAIEERIANLSLISSPPVWRVADVRGTVSKVDAFYATARYLNDQDFDRFFQAAQLVLSERDPAIDLPEDQRWTAGIYGKVRKHSAILRESICETLCILSVHGDELLGNSVGFSFRGRVDSLVRTLLSPLNPETLESQKEDLPYYAEAAPEAFLDLIENDLTNGDRAFLSLMKPAESGIFGNCPRTGLLWALETLAWDPSRLTRVVKILGLLAEVPLEDNWVNKPTHSLQCIFRSWLPQTAAPLERRKRALDYLISKFPSTGWKICVDQFQSFNRIGDFSHRPYWRPDAMGAGDGVPRHEDNDFRLHAFNHCLNWKAHDAQTLGDLVGNLGGVDETLRGQVWDVIENWAQRPNDDREKALLREKIRQTCFTRRGRRRNQGASTKERAAKVMDLLHPADLVERHRWLFEKNWVEFSADELEGDDIDWAERDRRIAEARKKAVIEVYDAEGLDGIWRLVDGGEGAYTAGISLEAAVDQPEDRSQLVRNLLVRRDSNFRQTDALLSGFLSSAHFGGRLAPVWDSMAGILSEDEKLIVLLRLPFVRETWDYAASLGEDFESQYWSKTNPSPGPGSDDDLRCGVDALLSARRARAAFSIAHFQLKKLESSQIEQMLRDMATLPAEQSDDYQFHGYDLARAFEELESRGDLTSSQLAQLEFLYVEALDHTGYRLPNFAREVAKNPQMFVEAIIYAYKRSDDGEDPQRYQVENEQAKRNIARAAHSALTQIRDIPGLDDGEVEKRTETLLSWVDDVRSGASEVARIDICDYQIGELLSRSPKGEDGFWPCEAVREAIDEIGTESVGRGLYFGIMNSRGVHSRMPGEGGDQERELAEQYRAWGETLADRWPSTARILFDVAESYERHAVRVDQETETRSRLKGWS